MVPGYEMAGIVDAVGSDVTNWKQGQRVGVGWHDGQCGPCEFCRRGDFFACSKERVTGLTCNDGYADYMITPMEALALIPDVPLSYGSRTSNVCRDLVTSLEVQMSVVCLTPV